MAFTGLVMVAMVHIDASRAVLLAYTTPLWCVVAAFLIFREAPSKAQVVALIIGLVGVGVSVFLLNWIGHLKEQWWVQYFFY